MDHQFPVLDEGNIQWRDATTKNGVSFQIGVKTTVDTVKEKFKGRATNDAHAASSTFSVSVRWTVGDTTWKSTPADVKRITAITRYSLHKNSDSIYAYRLNFTNTENYDYFFRDDSGEMYEVNTFSNGDHYLRYNSDTPSIVEISGYT